MYELSISILSLIGAIYLLWRIAMFLKTLLQLIFKPDKAVYKSANDKISELCYCNFTIFRQILSKATFSK